jgi:hypothetical protein
MTANNLDDLAQRVVRAVQGVSLVTDNREAVADDERAAIARVIALVQGWSVEDRHRRTRPLL